jgi:hypothetical protein
LEVATTAASQSPTWSERHASYKADMEDEQAVRTVMLFRR